MAEVPAATAAPVTPPTSGEGFLKRVVDKTLQANKLVFTGEKCSGKSRLCLAIIIAFIVLIIGLFVNEEYIYGGVTIIIFVAVLIFAIPWIMKDAMTN